ncbi:MAG: LacI family DNA-binding transcriptional regulator [Clostridia bacterium]|nr:LacI family DNA-binding transcriptional regulator [Clostridia bacterium]
MNIYDISEKAGVSIATVSRVLNNSPHVSQKTREKVLAVIDDCDYVPNAFARGLGLNTMKTIGLLCPDASDPYLANALSFLEKAFRKHHYDCLLCCTERSLDARQQGIEMLKSRHVDGIVLMGSTFVEARERDNAYIRNAAKQIPVVLLNASYSCENVYCVMSDEQRATMEATQYLLDTGRKNILYLYHSKNYNGQKKLAGYRSAIESRGGAVNEDLIRFFSDEKTDVPNVRDQLLALKESGLVFDAVQTSEDVLAIGAVKYAKAAGLSVPHDLSIIGHNNSGICQYSEPEITSVDNKLQAVSEQCVATMLGVLEGREMPQKIVFTGELIKRDSTL